MCSTCREEIINIQTGEILDWNCVDNLKENTMLKISSHLFKYWNFEKNNELGIDIYKVTKGQAKKAWWYCPVCDDTYSMSINKKLIDRGCSICSGYYVTPKNSFGGKYPDLAKEWHPTKNKKTPFDFSTNSGESVWWQCKNNEKHEWKTSINHRRNGTNCPFCNQNNPKVLKGENDLWTSHPQITKLLVNKEDGYKYSYGSNRKVKWKCEDCNHINNHSISDICNYLRCKKCSDKLSMGEKILYSLLDSINIDFIHEKTFEWSDSKRYDFYLPSISAIVEIHGEQHYIQTHRKGARSLEEEQENDLYKYELAKKNGIKHYIVIDARYSNFEFIKNNILNSELVKLLNLDNSNFNNLQIKANVLNKKTWELWNSGLRVTEISELLKISRKAVRNYLIFGSSLGKCDYKPEDRYERVKTPILKLDLKCNILDRYESLIEAKEYDAKKSLQITTYPFEMIRNKNNDSYIWVYEQDFVNYKELLELKLNEFNLTNNVCQLDMSFNLVSIFDNVVDASKKTGFDYFNIRAVCKNIRISSHGYRWMYLYNYENMINGKEYEIYENPNDKRMKTIVQLSMSGEYLCEYKNSTEAQNTTGVNSASITKCCRNERNHAGNFKWIYKSNYEKHLEQQNNEKKIS